MSRSGYSNDYELENWSLIRWRGQVASAIRGARGQAFLRELVDALDALPEKVLIADELQEGCHVCAIGSVGLRRGVDMSLIDPHDYDTIAGKFGIAHQLVQEIEWVNDEGAIWNDTPERRWQRMRDWAVKHIKKPAQGIEAGTGETRTARLDAKHASAGAKQSPKDNRP